jgi:outer membrane receptor for Fe3+-dicitrate
VKPSHGNYYELGLTKAFSDKFKIDATTFRRDANNFADDDQLLNTEVHFPIAFRKAQIYGAEAKLELPHWRRFSGFLSYSYLVGSVYFPVTGGLLLGSDVTTALSRSSGRFWDSQDQRHTLQGRVRYQIGKRAWLALSGAFGSGLPTAVDDTQQAIRNAIAQYGQSVVNRVDFSRGRVKPSLSMNLSFGTELWKHDQISSRLQADVENLNNRLNLIDFAGLFSGNAIGPPRSYALRLQTTF